MRLRAIRDPEQVALNGEGLAQIALSLAVGMTILFVSVVTIFSIAFDNARSGLYSRTFGDDFSEHRAEFEAAALWALTESPCDEYYQALPDEFAHLAVGGDITCWDNAAFFPQWARIVDDAGGYWYLTSGSPDGYEMWGLWCNEPTFLGGGWWSCAMPEAD